MQKLILHFGESSDQKHIYDLIVKMTGVPTDQLEACRDSLQSMDFEIYAIAHNKIEAMYSGTNGKVRDTLRELD